MNITVVKITDIKDAHAAIESTMHEGFEAKCTLDQLYMWEHSPSRTQLFWVIMKAIPSFVSVHLVRHAAVGQAHFVMTNRDDRREYKEGSVKTLLGLTPAGLHEVFSYANGKLYWKIKPYRSPANVGDLAGTNTADGRVEINYQRKRALRYRLIFLMHTGWCPPMLDHINGDASDDRIENLRPATKAENAYNIRKKEKYKGVSSHHTGKFRASIRFNGDCRHIGLFNSELEAAQAYDEQALQLFGEYARLNFDAEQPIGRLSSVNHRMLLNAQHLIDMSRKRLCHKASVETTEVMTLIKEAIREVDPALAKYMVRECVYRGGYCHEPRACGKYNVKRYDPEQIERTVE